MAQRLFRGLRVAKTLFLHQLKPINCISKILTRNYISDMSEMSEMRQSAFEGNILRLIRNDIQYELDHFPPSEPITEYKEFKVNELPGEQWIRLTRKFNEKEKIKIEATLFDGSVHVKGTAETPEHVKLHIPLLIEIFKENKDNDIFQFICSAWPDSIEIGKVFTFKRNQRLNQLYMGPGFKELDDELQNSLYDFLEERGIDEELVEFLHNFMKNKDKNEHVLWMEKLKSFILKK